MNPLTNMTIKHRLIVNAVIIAISLCFLFAIMLFNGRTLESLGQGLANVEKLEAQVLTLRRNEKDFLARKDLKYVDQFAANTQKLLTTLATVDDVAKQHGIALQQLTDFRQAVVGYRDQFDALAKFQVKIGLTPTDGLYGELRAAVHDVETLLKGQQSYLLLSDMLQLRRAEKDFMLRRDAKYLDTFDKQLSNFNQHLKQESLTGDVAQQIQSKLTAYQTKFKALVKAEQEIGLDEKSGLLGELRTTIHTTEKALDSMLMAMSAAIDQQIARATMIGSGGFLIAMAITLAFVYMTSQSIHRPVMAVRSAISQIRRNNDLTWLVLSKGKDELVEMADDVNSLVSDFRQLIENVNKALVTLDNATEELARNAQGTYEGMEKQFTESDMVATSGAEMQATVADINENTQLATKTAGETGELAKQGSEEVGRTAKNIQQLAAQLNDALGYINKLEKDSQTIGTVSDAIRGIAEQTNLLALNAAIEAARAGEQGRGFAVVADEVRSLAMRTQESTSEIESIISSLQQSTQTIVGVVNQCYQMGIDCSEQAQHAGESLVRIAAHVEDVIAMNSQISTSLQEQDTVATEMSKHVIHIRDIANEAKERAAINAQASRDIASQAAVLHQEVGRFKTVRH